MVVRSRVAAIALALAATLALVGCVRTTRPPLAPPPVPPATSTSPVLVSSPQPNVQVSSPLTVSGQAVGTWFFEASFPVRVEDANGLALGTGVAQAAGEWMTADYVPFSATVTFAQPVTETGSLVLVKDNPSGLPENDAAVRVPVRFTSGASRGSGGCIVTGCSSHICAAEPVMTTCEYAPSYACYRSARCERQADGQCGWTRTPEFELCLSQP